ncbi:MAG: TRAP transporter fused permease subunit [Alphaproteobacteria bacterium]
MARSKLIDPSTWFSVGCRRRPTGWLAHAITCFAAVLAVYVVLAATVIILDPWALSAIFLAGMMTLVFLVVGATPHSDPIRPSVIDFLFSAISFASGIFLIVNVAEFEVRISLMYPLDTWQMVFGTLIFLLTLEITRRTTGLGLMVVVLVFIAYNFFGHLIGGVLGHGYIDYNHFLDIMVYTTDGIMGLPVRVAATYAFLFVLFGTFLFYAKGSDFFFDFAAAIAGRKPGGPAKVAVVSSAMYGMISGSPTSDVVTTGSITIPIMKRLGYKASIAGAIEVAASTGGSLVPPVMGSAAFIMAEYTGIDYADIAIAALLPAILYYVGVYSQVHFRAVRVGFGGLDPSNIPKMLPTLKRGGLFLVPLVALTVALLQGYTPTMVAVFGSLAVLVVAAVKKDTRLGPIKIYQALAETSIRMVPVAGACAAAGLVIAGITMTGLAAKFAHVIYAITEAQVFFTLVIAAALTVILGLGMPTPSAYILAAVLIGPLLAELKIPDLTGHLFLLYFAVMSAITPPVAVAAYAASSIAEANPLEIAGHAVRLALAAFLVPFTFIYGPELVWMGPVWKTAVTFASAAAGIILIAAAIEGYRRLCAVWWTRALAAVAGLFLMAPFMEALAIGIGLAAIGAAGNMAVNRLRQA